MRLTNDIRRRLTDRVIQRAFDEKIDAELTKVKKLAIKIIDDEFGEEIAAIRKITKNFARYVNTRSHITVEDTYKREKLLRNWSSYDSIDLQDFYMPGNVYNLRVAAIDGGTGEIDKSKQCLIVEAYRNVSELRMERDKAWEELSNSLSGITTVKKLADTWPELVPDLDAVLVIVGASPALPAVIDHNELNNKLGLPPKEEK